MSIKSHRTQIDRWFIAAAVIGIVFVFWKIVEPFALVTITALAAGIVFTPLQRKLAAKLKNEGLAAALVSLFVLLGVVIPLLILLFVIIKQAGELVEFLQGVQISSDNLPPILQQQLATVDLNDASKFISNWIVSNVGAVFASTAGLFLDLFIFFIAFHYALTSRKQLHKSVLELSPLRDSADEKIIHRVIETVRSVVFGSLLVALIQGIVTTIGMILLGLPGAVIWGVLTTILAPIPIVGTGLVMVPAAIYFFATGNIFAGIGMLILLVIVGMIYNILAPRLIERKTKMHSFLILISLLGGLNLFGPIGFIVGPSVLAIIIVLVELHKAGALK